jgi:hypothetical protein
LNKDNLEAATRVVQILEQEDAAFSQQWKLRIERAQYEARRAERQYDACDPDNRIVARTLETRWNDKLAEVERIEREHQDLKQRRRLELNDLVGAVSEVVVGHHFCEDRVAGDEPSSASSFRVACQTDSRRQEWVRDILNVCIAATALAALRIWVRCMQRFRSRRAPSL